MHNIIIYEDKNGESEIEKYLHGLSIKNDKDSRIKYNKIIAYVRVKDKLFKYRRTIYKTSRCRNMRVKTDKR